MIYWDIAKLIKMVLSERECHVLGLRLQGYTLRQVADNIDRTPARVRDIEHAAYARLHKIFKANYK